MSSNDNGHLYWRSISPFHGLVFGGMPRNVAVKALAEAAAGGRPYRRR